MFSKIIRAVNHQRMIETDALLVMKALISLVFQLYISIIHLKHQQSPDNGLFVKGTKSRRFNYKCPFIRDFPP